MSTTDLYDQELRTNSSELLFLGCSTWLGVGGVDTSAGTPWGSPAVTGVSEGPVGSSKGNPDASAFSRTGGSTATGIFQQVVRLHTKNDIQLEVLTMGQT